MFANNQLFAAPLAGITDKPFRKMVRMFSPDVRLVTEMISCHSLVEQHKNCPRNFDSYDDEGDIGAQIFGAVPELMGTAAKILQDQGAKWIDINMGCPVPKVATRSGAGAYLMRDHVLAGKIMTAVVDAVDIPVSIKTRLGWDSDSKDWRDLVNIAYNSGVSWVALHGRTRAQGYLGNAELPDVHECPLPIIANGDIRTKDDIEKVQVLGYSGAMIGRGMLGQPWIFDDLLSPEKYNRNIEKMVLQHLEFVLEYYGEKVGVPMFRKHVAWYSSGMPNSGEFRVKINSITTESELKLAISEFLGCV